MRRSTSSVLLRHLFLVISVNVLSSNVIDTVATDIIRHRSRSRQVASEGNDAGSKDVTTTNLFHPSPRIIGGSDSVPGRYPYMASLTMPGHSGNGIDHICGGTLIAPDIILTAAHCINPLPNAKGQVVRVREIQLGRYDFRDDSETYESYVIDTEVPHPLYDFSRSWGHYDLALLKVYGQSNAAVVTMNRNESMPAAEGDQLHVIGWGVTTPGGTRPNDKLLEVTLDYVPNNICEEASGTFNGVNLRMSDFISEASMCASDNGEDACQGDSGGPLLVAGSTSKPEDDLQVGVVSFGIGCANPSFHGIYSRISHMHRWMDRKVCELSNDPPAEFGCPVPAPTPSPTVVQVPVTIEIQLDEYPQETGWILESVRGGTTTIYANRPIFTYADHPPSSLISETVMVDMDRTYKFSGLDRYGDGFCCSTGDGYYRIYNGIGQQIHLVPKESASFEHSVSHMFDMGTPPAPEPRAPYVTIRITFDEYPQETAWSLEALEGESGNDSVLVDATFAGSYTGLSGQNISKEVDLFADVQNYVFKITDTKKDGICCVYGSGLYEVWLGSVTEGMLLFNGSVFESVDENSFEVPDNQMISFHHSPSPMPSFTPSGVPSVLPSAPPSRTETVTPSESPSSAPRIPSEPPSVVDSDSEKEENFEPRLKDETPSSVPSSVSASSAHVVELPVLFAGGALFLHLIPF